MIGSEAGKLKIIKKNYLETLKLRGAMLPQKTHQIQALSKWHKTKWLLDRLSELKRYLQITVKISIKTVFSTIKCHFKTAVSLSKGKPWNPILFYSR